MKTPKRHQIIFQAVRGIPRLTQVIQKLMFKPQKEETPSHKQTKSLQGENIQRNSPAESPTWEVGKCSLCGQR